MRIFNQSLSAMLLYDGTYLLAFDIKRNGEKYCIEMIDEGVPVIMATYSTLAQAKKELAAVEKFCANGKSQNFIFGKDCNQ